jgi:hypothetical protein
MVNPDNQRPPRVRASIRRVLYWLLPVLLLIGAWQIWDAVEAARLTRAISHAFPEGMPSDAAGPRRPGGEPDAGVYYAAANMAAVAIGFRTEDRRPSGPEVTTAVRESLMNNADPPPDVARSASEYLALYGMPLRLIEEAREYPYGGATPGPESAYRLSGLSTLAGLTGLRMLDLIRRGETDSAFDALIARMQFVRAFADRPGLLDTRLRMQQMQRLATDTGILLSRATLSDAQLTTLLDTFDAVAGLSNLDEVIAFDASRLLGALESIWNGRRAGAGALVWLARPVLRHHATALIQITADARAAARLPWRDRAAAMAAIDERRSIVPELIRFIAPWRILPQLQDATASMAAGVAAERRARMAVALERYRRQFRVLPARLIDLASDLGMEQMQDPFTGETLKYTQNGREYVVYSIGSDGRDDGGTLMPDLPRGRMPGTVPPPDVGTRVSNLR